MLRTIKHNYDPVSRMYFLEGQWVPEKDVEAGDAILWFMANHRPSLQHTPSAQDARVHRLLGGNAMALLEVSS